MAGFEVTTYGRFSGDHRGLKRTSNRYFSPWRGEMRDVGGILHGLYVFTVVARFLGKLQKMNGLDQFSLEHIERRRTEIRRQILQLETFRTSSDVSSLGMLLRHHLFQANGLS
jgi:HEXXH motif-containing protein